MVCGLAIYNFTIVDLHFPLALYKKLLKKKPSLDDLKELMPDVGRLVVKNGKGGFRKYGICIESFPFRNNYILLFFFNCQNKRHSNKGKPNVLLDPKFSTDKLKKYKTIC